MRRQHIIAEMQTAGRAFIRQVLPVETTCTLRYNAASTAYLTVKDTHPVVPQLMDDGIRAAVWMVTVDGNTLTRKRLLEGVVGDPAGEGPYGTVTFPVIDDFNRLNEILGWQKPSAPITAQTDEYARYTGPSETRALAAIAAAKARLALSWDLPASVGRGTTGTTEFRMDPLVRLIDALNADRLQLTIQRNPDTDRWVVAITEGTTYARPLTPQSGVLSGWRWNKQRPKATRAAVGGAGEGVARAFKLVTDPTLEAQLQRIIEIFVDARQAEAGADLTPNGTQALTDAAAKAGITATLRETSWFRFPDAYDLGTRVSIQVGAFAAEDVITEIEIKHAARTGFTVTPKVGFATNDPQQRLTQFVAGLASSVRSLERR